MRSFSKRDRLSPILEHYCFELARSRMQSRGNYWKGRCVLPISTSSWSKSVVLMMALDLLLVSCIFAELIVEHVFSESEGTRTCSSSGGG